MSPLASADADTIEWATVDPANSVLFLGAGVSVPTPAGAPLFGEVRTACAEVLGIPAASWSWDDPRQKLLQQVVPEVFLSGVAAAGLSLNEALADMVTGGPEGQPNSVHRAAAEFLSRGGTVWTTNWDLFIEQAAGGPITLNRLRKIHGDAAEPATLQFKPGSVIRPIPKSLSDELVESARSRTAVVAGYGGADVDIFPALRAALAAASDVIWLEGTPTRNPADAPDYSAAEYEAWRFGLTFDADPRALQRTSGKRVVWCGNGANELGPSNALLRLLGSVEPACQATGWEARLELALSCLRAHELELDPSKRALARAALEDRLGMRAKALLHFTRALAGGAPERRRAVGAIGRSLQPVSNGIRRSVGGLRRYVRPGDGGQMPGHDPLREGSGLDSRLAAVAEVRWNGDLQLALEGSKIALVEAMQKDLDDREHNWVERVARASFEQANVLLWQGRHEAADEICRAGLMRLTGPKWVAWELSIRASAASVRNNHALAERLSSLALEINTLEHNLENRLALLIGRAQVRRLADDLHGAEKDLTRAREAVRDHPLLADLLLLEHAELRSGQGHASLDDYLRLSGSRVPLVAATASLRLAEFDNDPEHLDRATKLFRTTNCMWGIARTDAHAGRAWSAARLDAAQLTRKMCRPLGLVII